MASLRTNNLLQKTTHSENDGEDDDNNDLLFGICRYTVLLVLVMKLSSFSALVCSQSFVVQLVGDEDDNDAIH